jgi:hypothetical protein
MAHRRRHDHAAGDGCHRAAGVAHHRRDWAPPARPSPSVLRQVRETPEGEGGESNTFAPVDAANSIAADNSASLASLAAARAAEGKGQHGHDRNQPLSRHVASLSSSFMAVIVVAHTLFRFVRSWVLAFAPFLLAIAIETTARTRTITRNKHHGQTKTPDRDRAIHRVWSVRTLMRHSLFGRFPQSSLSIRPIPPEHSIQIHRDPCSPHHGEDDVHRSGVVERPIP